MLSTDDSIRCTAMALGALFAGLAPGPSRLAADDVHDVVIGQELRLHSKILNEDRRYVVYLPDGYKSIHSRSYPVLYLLDGGAHDRLTFGIVHHLSSSSSAVFRIPPMVLVSLPNTKRTRDLTPSRVTSGPYSQDSGGSAAFLRFMEEELFPIIESRYRTSSERTLVGHSLSGLFALHVFLERPELFRNYIAIDPSLREIRALSAGQTRESCVQMLFLLCVSIVALAPVALELPPSLPASCLPPEKCNATSE